jgi:Dienelactone hydrolase family
VEKTGERRPWKSQERFPLSHSFNNNKLDDRDHFQQNAKTSVASLRGLIGSSRNIDRHHNGMLIAFIGIPKFISKSAQAEIKAALANKPNATVFSYPGQNHAFSRHNGAHYNAAVL